MRLCHFQPRLGIITRTMSFASSDLFHFVIVLGTLYLGFSLLTFLVFGSIVAEYSTFSTSLSTNFNILAMQDSSFLSVFFELPEPLIYPGCAVSL